MAIIPRENGMLISTIFFADEVKDLPKSYNKPKASDAELNMAKTLINSMDTPFKPQEYQDEFQGKLRELLETKIAGKEVVATPPEEHGNVIDLMEALKASLEQQNKPAPRKKRGA